MNNSCNGNCEQGRACDCDDARLTTPEVALFVGIIATGAGLMCAGLIAVIVWLGSAL